MAIFNTDFYYGDDKYSDGSIEDEIFDIVKTGKRLEELEEVNYPILYHLSNVRENILNWFPFEETAHVLEIGAGCGAITGALCRKTEKVVSVELSKRRASINYERHKQIDNLEIRVGNLNDMEFDDKFDYVILNGVFEYAMSYTDGDKPYHRFLLNMLKFLKKDGKVLIAIENRLGLKYFAGAPEEHTDAFVEGINGYEFNESVRTFSKHELIQILDDCGLTFNRFYYPYPDYKFPTEIFTDESLKHMEYGKEYYNFLDKRMELFNESLVAKTLAKEDVVAVFANSFLVEASFENVDRDSEVLYVKPNGDRNIEFQIATLIEKKDDEKFIVKEALTNEAQKYIDNLFCNEKVLRNEAFHNFIGEKWGAALKYPYLDLENVDMDIKKYIEKKDSDKIIELLTNIFDSLLPDVFETANIYSDEFRMVFGKETILQDMECVKPANIDLICDNIFKVGTQYVVSNCEWVFDFWIPKSFIVWRCLNELYVKHGNELRTLIPNQQLESIFGISEEMKQVFKTWNRHFTEVYVGGNRLHNYAKPKMRVSLDQVYNKLHMKRCVCSSLYYDCGVGFSEENKIYTERILDGNDFVINYDLSNVKNITNLRWDPAEQRACKCSVKAFADGKEIGVKAFNAEYKEGQYDVFMTNDPIYLMQEICGEVEKLEIVGSISYMDEREVLERHENTQNALREMSDIKLRTEEQLENVRLTLESMNAQLQELSKQKAEDERKPYSILTSKVCRLLEKIR